MESSVAVTEPVQGEGVTEPVQGEENPEVNNLLHIAQALRDEKAALFARIDANRQILRNYRTLGYLSDEQVSAIEAFYPPHRAKATEDAPAETPAEPQGQDAPKKSGAKK